MFPLCSLPRMLILSNKNFLMKQIKKEQGKDMFKAETKNMQIEYEVSECYYLLQLFLLCVLVLRNTYYANTRGHILLST